jgi:hypothetical protein
VHWQARCCQLQQQQQHCAPQKWTSRSAWWPGRQSRSCPCCSACCSSLQAEALRRRHGPAVLEGLQGQAQEQAQTQAQARAQARAQAQALEAAPF